MLLSRNKDLKIFALNSSFDFGIEVTSHLGINLSKHEEKRFHDGETYVSSKENIRGRDVFVIQSLYGDNEESVNDKLMKLLIFIGSLKDASAGRITAVIPYFCYFRQDRKIHSREPITSKYVTRLLEAVKTKRLLTMDIHNQSAIQNSNFKMCVDLLEANIIFANYLGNSDFLSNNMLIMSPDAGSLSRSRKFIKILQNKYDLSIGYACLNKIHDGSLISGRDIMGDDVQGKDVVIYDDMISSGKSVHCCVESLKNMGARRAMVIATHGLFVSNFEENLSDDFLEKIVVTDSVKSFRVAIDTSVYKKLRIIKSTEIFAKAILHIHKDESISELLAAC